MRLVIETFVAGEGEPCERFTPQGRLSPHALRGGLENLVVACK